MDTLSVRLPEDVGQLGERLGGRGPFRQQNVMRPDEPRPADLAAVVPGGCEFQDQAGPDVLCLRSELRKVGAAGQV
ncbi:hypothetical protein ACFWV1_05880 [Streptomyces sp. NPDC058700]|uniref:hypothetical protein n=1 Tax=Streptomyces sp. NPDC058700 TaxID=3346607 RepID=UPI003649F7C0